MHLPGMLHRSRPIAALVVAAALLTSCADSSAPVTIEVTPTIEAPAPATHVVVRGETLSIIARATGVSVDTLVELNDIQNPNLIEPGLVLLLEPQPEAPAARRPATEPEASDPVVTWLNDRWDELRPHLTLSDRSIEEGAIAGLLLPAIVIGLVAVWLLFTGARTALFTLIGHMPRRSEGRSAEPATVEAETPVSERKRGTPNVARLLRRAVPPAPSTARLRNLLSRSAAASRRGATHFAGTLSRGAAATVTSTEERVRHARAAHTERRLQQDVASRQAALRTDWWRPGMEALRIGLLDEAGRCFESGLEAARAEGWHDEIALFEESLERVRERTGGVAVSTQA